MIAKNTPHTVQDGQTQPASYFDTLSEQMPQMQTLFEKLSSNQHPDFMTVWAAISEMVAFYTDSDSFCDDHSFWLINRSQNKCRVCS